MKIIKRGINAVIPFLLANVYLLARCPEWNIPLMPLIVVVLIAGYVLLTVMPFLGLKNIQSSGIRRCQRGCENLYSFLAATVMSVAVLILMLVHVIDVEELGSVHTHGGGCTGGHILGWNNKNICVIQAARYQMESDRYTVRLDSGGTSDSPWQADKSGIR